MLSILHESEENLVAEMVATRYTSIEDEQSTSKL